MRLPAGYAVQELLYESGLTLVVRALDSGGKPVILKTLKPESGSAENRQLFYQEYTLTHRLEDHPHVIKTIGIEQHQDTVSIILEDFGALSLDKMLNKGQLPLERVLTIAIVITEALSEIHGAGIVHKDINPSNIVVNPENGRLRLIDFGIAAPFSKEKRYLRKTNLVEGTLAYLAPEQTGRIFGRIDHRSDFYAFGATLYELLVHKPPFGETDQMALIHSHLARQPIPPSHLDADLPQAVSDIVMRLMAKDAEERYQTADAIRADLEKCLELLKQGHDQFSFPVGLADGSPELSLPSKPYGRSVEAEAIKAAYTRVCSGEKVILLVTGPAGIGKTALVQQLQGDVHRHRGIFVSGKFNLLQPSFPFSAIVQAFSQLARHILSGTNETLAGWQKTLRAVIGDLGFEIINLIPAFETILGPQKPVAELGPTEAQNRFFMMFENLIGALACPEHPLVLFLDDLQWIDPSSLELIKRIIGSPVIKSLLIIGAYRDDEVPADHPLTAMLNAVQEEGTTLQSLPLAPLNGAAVVDLVADTLGWTQQTAQPLAEWIHTRSFGNPFHLKELMVALNKQKIVTYDALLGRWQWSATAIEALELPDNITILLSIRIQSLRPDTQKILMLAAFIGLRFDLDTLSMVVEADRQEIVDALLEAKQAGLILSEVEAFELSGDERVDGQPKAVYLFAHDRVHAAAYSGTSEEEAAKLHRRIGQLLLRRLSQEQREARIFEIVNHRNKGIPDLHYTADRQELARHNLAAGRKAKTTLAFDQAYLYFRTGIELLEGAPNANAQADNATPGPTMEAAALVGELYHEAIEAACLCARYDEVDRLGQIMLARTPDVVEQLYIYGVLAKAYHARNLIQETIATALIALRRVGIRVNDTPGKRDVLVEYLKTRYLLAGRSLDRLIQKAPETAPEMLGALNIIQNTCISLYFVDPSLYNANLFPVLIFKGIQYCLRYGDQCDRTLGFAGYAALMSSVFGRLNTGYRFAEAALKHAARLDTGPLHAKIFLAASVFSFIWKKHVKYMLAHMHAAHVKGLETGDFDFSSFAAYFETAYRFYSGEELGQLQNRGEHYLTVTGQLQQKTAHQYLSILMQTMVNLQGSPEQAGRYEGPYYHANQMLPVHREAQDGGALTNYHLAKAMVCLLFGQVQEAVDHLAEVGQYIFNQSGNILVSQFCFYDSLAALSMIPRCGPGKRRALFKKVKANQKKMKKWARSAAVNYLHKYLLIDAEWHRIRNHPDKAAALYDRAIEASKTGNYMHETALANELAARFHSDRGHAEPARDYIKEAWHHFFQWGAKAKLAQLESRYPDVRPDPGRPVDPARQPATETITGVTTDVFDWASVLEASVSISGEIVFEKLIAKLMRILIKNSGADKGVLLLSEKDALQQVAIYPPAPNGNSLSQAMPLRACSHLPRRLIRYVGRTMETTVLGDIGENPLFANDGYLAAHPPKSLLCMPLQNKSRLMGIIYLENSLLAGVFSTSRLAFLNVLAAQISVSLENAGLYRHLETQTQALGAVNKKLQAEVEQRRKAESELRRYRDQLKKEYDAQALELDKSKRTIAHLGLDTERRLRFGNMVGKSDAMQTIYTLVKDLADVSTTVLVRGESGSGKELVAQALHHSGSRGQRPFVKVNCSALSAGVLESELFGHVKGAFTGADKDKVGRFQKAKDGTILLDEIGDISLHFQQRLLRVLQEREFERLGDTATLPMRARVIAATNQNLMEKVRRHEFREDLYYRLKVVEIRMPPLRERKEDIPLLVQHFVSMIAKELNKEIAGVSQNVLKKLIAYHWPGNVRELRNVIECLGVLCKDSIIRKNDFPEDFADARSTNGFAENVQAGALPLESGSADKEAVIQALKQARWNKTEASRILAISRRTLYRKMRKYKIS
jgi:predicted ATPase/transcriptional regulator with GAF, ATPase, and Fis domain